MSLAGCHVHPSSEHCCSMHKLHTAQIILSLWIPCCHFRTYQIPSFHQILQSKTTHIVQHPYHVVCTVCSVCLLCMHVKTSLRCLTQAVPGMCAQSYSVLGKEGGGGGGGAVCTRMFSLVLSKSEFLSAERGVVAPTSQAPGLMFPQHSVFCH